ncbi:LOW QUALITY PROTEIN: DNA polymerase III alpha subunit [Bacillus sp. JCM 19046]|nr:LOW QUALITY PROTEIN: DNA polymerase III alpha subunit [Bacillus sp. JCM 19046]
MQALLSNIYSEYSLLQSINRIEEFVAYAKQNGYSSLGLTDRNVLYGAVPFIKLVKRGLSQLSALNATMAGDQRVPVRLLAKSKAGYRQLVAISSKINLDPKNQGINLDFFQQETTECVVCLFKDSFYSAKNWSKRWQALTSGATGVIELSGDDDYQLIQFAKAFQLTCIAAPPIRFLQKGNSIVYRLVRAIDAGSSLEHISVDDGMESAYLLSIQELQQSFSTEVLEATNKLAKEIETELPLNEPHIPSYDSLSEEEADAKLKEECEVGLTKRYGEDPTEQQHNRLKKELHVIAEMGYSSYFLIVADFMRYAKEQGILTGPGRGSSASSIVAFTLFITDVDPLKHDLLFERFLNPERISLPDIDIDFPDYRRDEMIQYVKERFGRDKVAQVLTFGTFAGKAAIRDAGKALSLKSSFVDQVAKSLTPASLPLIEAIEKGLFKSLKSPELDQLLFFARQLEGLPRHVSTHAAGVIISDAPLQNKVALQHGSDQVPITQADMNSLEALGLVKFDFLGLRNLTLLEQILQLIYRQTGQSIDLQSIPFDDEPTFRLLQAGKSTGIFQLESAGMRSVLKQLKPTHFGDIVATSALYRPGPMDFIPEYIKGKAQPKDYYSANEEINKILKPTLGVVVYQEQIIKLLQVSAGYSLAEADVYRRAITKKRPSVMNEDQFVTRAVQNGLQKEEAAFIFSLIERFANYGFPKSHATAYSFISYWLAYLRVHYAAAFFAALCSSSWQSHSKLYAYLYEARREGIRVLPPSVFKSDALFTLEGEAIRFGLLPIARVNLQAVQLLKSVRTEEDENLFSFYARVNAVAINQNVLESFIKAGALDEWNQPRSVLLANLDKAKAFADQVMDFKESAGDLFTIKPATPNYIAVKPSSKIEELEWEKEVLGFYLTGHPIENEQERLVQFGRTKLADSRPSRKKFGLLRCYLMKKYRLKKEKRWLSLRLVDESDECSCVAFPQVWKAYESVLQDHALVFLEGFMEERTGKKQFIVQKAIDIKQVGQGQTQQALYVRMKANLDTPTKLSDLKYILSLDSGVTPVILHREREKTTKRLADEYSVAPSRKTIQLLSQLFGKENVVLKDKS